MNLAQPILLDPKNFTSLTQTPWAGTMLAQSIKSTQAAVATPIGESWEFSCDPKFPSKVFDSNVLLRDLFAKYPNECFAKNAQTMSCDILVKLLNAQAPLSLQIHPEDHDPNLKANESGKPESWLVLEAKEGAGIYLGFSKKLSREELKKKLTTNEFSKSDLLFLPVKKFDYFEISPGVVHSLGPDIVILEPQRVLDQKSGKTYRLWDWNRLYDSNGRPASDGKPRELHIEEALPLINFEQQHGLGFANSLKRSPNVFMTSQELCVRSYPQNDCYQTILCSSEQVSQTTLRISNGYGSLTILNGSLSLQGPNSSEIRVGKGCSAFLPFATFPLKLKSDARSEFAFVVSKNSGIDFE